MSSRTDRHKCGWAVLALLWLGTGVAWSQVAAPAPVAVVKGPVAGPAAPAAAKEPLLRLEAGGPTTDVTTLAFSPDGQTLYAAGWDKVVRVWQRDANTNEFVAQRNAFRVPIGPGLFGAINAMAISEDGKWLAVGGIGTFQGQAGFRHPGLVVPADTLTVSMREDLGTIYVFDTAKPDQPKSLKGHRGSILSLAFVQASPAAQPLLVSAGSDFDVTTGQSEGGLRLWDVAVGTLLAKHTGLPDAGSKLPGLAAWKSGPNANQVHVAAAWDDGDLKTPGALRLWDVEKQQILRAGSEGSFNNTVAYLRGESALLTGSFLNNDGRLQKWTAPSHETPKTLASQASFPVENTAQVTRFHFPRALTTVSAKGDGRLDHAAVVLRVVDTKAKRTEHRLQLVSLTEPGRAFASIRLWPDGRMPVLASSPRGGHVAVAGGHDHSIHVYAIADLLAGRGNPQLLRSIAMQPGDAAFVKQVRDGKTQIGLVFAEGVTETRGTSPRKLFARDMIFDFVGRRLISADSGWSHDTPDLAGWSASVTPPAGATPAAVTVRSPAGAEKRISLPVAWSVSDFALLPPQPNIPAPLLAVAYHVGNSPRFSLYNATSGEQLAEFTGHLNKIRSVAFSGDGRLLVTASDDQTVCLWSLNKLDQFIGRQGQLHGLVVQTNADKLVVTGTSAEMREAGLKKDDVIAGMVAGDKLEPLASPLELQNAVLKHRPNDNVTLRLGDGRDVALRAGQAIQQRTPLLMLFVTNGGRAEEREWLAWNPVGPYDSSDPKVVRSFGWHFNPAKPGEAVEFTSAEKDLAKERREGLLRHILARASLSPALEDYDNERKEKPLPPPKMTMGIDGMKDRVVRHETNTVWLNVAGIPAERIESVRWSIDGGADSASKETGSDHTREVTLKRGSHKIRAVVRTREDVPQEFAETLTVRYIPPPPTLTPAGEAAKLDADAVLEVMKPTFTLSAGVKPGAATEKTVVQIYHQQAPLDKEPVATTALTREIALKPGLNQIEVHALHEGTEKDTEGAELSRLVLNVKYTPPAPPKDAPPPTILLEAVIPLVGGVEPGEHHPVLREGTPVVVSTPKIRVIGKITATGRLATAEWDDGVKSGSLLFEREAPGVFFVNQPLTLTKTGLQTITFRARTMTESGQKTTDKERLLQIDYRPALPLAAGLFASPAGPIFFDEGKGSPEIQIGGRLLQPRDASTAKVTATALVNDKEFPAVIDATGKNWSAKVRLAPGSNRIQVMLDNGWQDAVSGNLRLEFRRPPLNLRTEAPAQTAEPIFMMEAKVDSVLPLKADYVRATVRGKEVRDVLVIKPSEPDDKTWKIHFAAQLKAGNNEIRILVGNDDGSTLPLVRTVKFEPKKALPPAPAVAFLQPALSSAASDLAMSVSRSKFPVQFEVRASSSLKRIALSIRREGQKTDVKELDLAAAAKTPAGTFLIKVGAELDLAPGVTWIALEAEDQSTRTETAPLVVNYLPPPVRLQLETLEPRDGKSAALPIQEGTDGKWTCVAVPDARMRLVGKVLWSEKDAQLLDKQVVSVFVNGSQQWRGELEPAGDGLSRRFKADVLLNRDKGNDIEVELPSLKLADNRHSNVLVDCKKPLTEQWLHVQVVSPEEANESKLLEQVLKSLHGANHNKETGEFTRPGFQRSRLYAPLIAGVDYDKLAERLLQIRRDIAQRSQEGWPNDVVLLYFAGGETVDTSGRLQSLTQSTSSHTLITRDQIAKQFSDMLGVKVLLLDVMRPRASAKSVDEKVEREVARWLEAPTRHAWIRAAWLNADAPPEETRLLTALHEAMNNADLLGDLPHQVGQRFRQLSQRFPTLQADWYLPQALHGLTLREKKDRP